MLAIAARQQRTGRDNAATMLIHTHHRQEVQHRIGQLVREHVSQLRQSWRYDRQSIRPLLHDRWNRRFRPVVASVNTRNDVAFEEIEEHIDGLFRDPLRVLILNSTSQDVLDYEADPTVKAVVIGGNRLSRGLTLEGLLVSYYVRRTQYFDTLMQMGRWFGFREQYVDLTRIWTTDELWDWFRDLALAEEELRREIARYERENLTPLDFGPRIRSHPVMMITAQNKMGGARVVSQSYSGYLLQTTSFRFEDTGWLQSNLATAQQLITQLGRPNLEGDSPHQPAWQGVPWQTVDAFLAQYRLDPRATHEMGAIRQYLREQAHNGELTEWLVSVRGRSTVEASLGTEPILTVNGTAVNRIGRTRLKNAPHSIGSLVNPATLQGTPGSGDEEIGLSRNHLTAARREAEVTGDFPDALRRQRDRTQGVLLLYPISPFSRPRSDEGNRLTLFADPASGVTVVGIALVFPVSQSPAAIEYVVGTVGPMPEGTVQ